jgi:siroheme synthase-like protein
MNRGDDSLFLPVSLQIAGKKLVIVGGGNVALHKANLLRRFTDEAEVIAPAFHPGFDNLPFRQIKKEYEPAALDGAFLVYICTGNAELNASIKSECERRGLLASVCDNPRLCDFISPAIYKAGEVTISVSSNARNVKQSIKIRDRIGQLVDNQALELG